MKVYRGKKVRINAEKNKEVSERMLKIMPIRLSENHPYAVAFKDHLGQVAVITGLPGPGKEYANLKYEDGFECGAWVEELEEAK